MAARFPSSSHVELPDIKEVDRVSAELLGAYTDCRADIMICAAINCCVTLIRSSHRQLFGYPCSAAEALGELGKLVELMRAGESSHRYVAACAICLDTRADCICRNLGNVQWAPEAQPFDPLDVPAKVKN